MSISDLPNILFISPLYENSVNINNAYDYGNAISLLSTKFHELPTDNWLEIIDTFHIGNMSFEKGANLFPNKMNNLLGRSLRLSIFNYQPYAIINKVVSKYFVLYAFFVHLILCACCCDADWGTISFFSLSARTFQ